jgi:hypothetical protein
MFCFSVAINLSYSLSNCQYSGEQEEVKQSRSGGARLTSSCIARPWARSKGGSRQRCHIRGASASVPTRDRLYQRVQRHVDRPAARREQIHVKLPLPTRDGADMTRTETGPGMTALTRRDHSSRIVLRIYGGDSLALTAQPRGRGRLIRGSLGCVHLVLTWKKGTLLVVWLAGLELRIRESSVNQFGTLVLSPNFQSAFICILK